MLIMLKDGRKPGARKNMYNFQGINYNERKGGKLGNIYIKYAAQSQLSWTVY